MKFVCVFHGPKVEGGLASVPREIGANPPMTVPGMEQVLKLVPKLREEGPYVAMFSSRLARALCTASVIGAELDMDFSTVNEFGQYGNKDGGEVIMYPGHEDDNLVTWQRCGIVALGHIVHGLDRLWEDVESAKMLIVSHRPIIGGLIAHTRGVFDKEGIGAIVNDPAITKNGYVVFNWDKGDITLVS